MKKQNASDGLKLKNLQESDNEDEMSDVESEEPSEELCEESSEEPSGEPSEEPSEEPSGECASEPTSDRDSDNDTEHTSKSVPHNLAKAKTSAIAGPGASLQEARSQNNPKWSFLEQQSDAGQATSRPRSQPTISKTLDNNKNTSEGQENAGAKKRRSRWDAQLEAEGDGTAKQRKTRWEGDDSHLKAPGPVIPDFVKHLLAGVNLDSEVQKMSARLVEINRKLQERKAIDDRPEEQRSPSPPPLYNNLGIRTNTREVRYRQKLIQERQNITSRLIAKSPTFKSPSKSKPPKLYKKLFIPFKEYPGYNFIGLILGPQGNTQKRMEKETGARIRLRGKGSEKEGKAQPRKDVKPDPSEDEDTHVLIEADNQRSLDAAASMVEKLLIPVEEGMNEHKLAQLKELAELKGTLRGGIVCRSCGGHGHVQQLCPSRNSLFKMDVPCQVCGDSSHATSGCPLTASVDNQYHSFLAELGLGPVSSVPGSVHPASGTLPSHGLGSTAAPESKPIKEIDDSNLFVGYLPSTVDDDQLKELFSPFGRINRMKVLKDRTTGLSKGCGFVKYCDPVDAAKAVAHMHGYKIDGKMLVVRVAGRQSATPLLLPPYPGPPSLPPQDNHGQSAWPGPPGSMLPESNASLHKSKPLSMPPRDSLSRQVPAPDMSLYRVPISSSGMLTQFPSNESSTSRYARFTDSFSGQLPSSSYGSSSQLSISPPSLLGQFPGNWCSSFDNLGPSSTFGGPLSSSRDSLSCQNSIPSPTSLSRFHSNGSSSPGYVAKSNSFSVPLPSSHWSSSCQNPSSSSSLLSQFPGNRSSSPSRVGQSNSLGMPPSSYGLSLYQNPISSPSSLSQFPGMWSHSPGYVGRSNSLSGPLSSSYGPSSYQNADSSPVSLAQFPGNLSSSTTSLFQSHYATTDRSLSSQIHLTSSLGSSQKTPTWVPEQDKRVIEPEYEKILSKISW
ncbi:splicing factor-like protein 1 [Magnolia sinica]|uniref:splicing factor-like protein 1 n=1 Tax=Magnolia sinica TaxID=86752 RepID=UPI00265AE868|nr:splicing factor-like protein 1 [Magnolia sinica]XP_058075879.1 splicing factor-like protein 1 [Magnolia sinica]XP_058075880.1 splicing factor-like protein 1 [Magnolia sinica]XP_058075881.1 splicing factor-like protein 1 [Magnolia sinica]